jgi:hypothetical protein
MITTTPLGTVQLPTAHGGIPLHVCLETGPAGTPATDTTPSQAANAGRPAYVAITVVGEVDNHALDLGVSSEDITVDTLPTDIDELVRTEPVAHLITEYAERLADLTVQLAGLALATPDGVPVVFTVADLEYLRHCLSLTERCWREAIAAADTAAQQPQRENPPSPGYMTIEPTPTGYLLIAGRFRAELERVEQFRQRLERLLDLARAATDEDGEPT